MGKENSNEYAQTVSLQLPDSTRVHVTNVYLPPASSLQKRNIDEDVARAHVHAILEQIPPQHTSLVCGDFNARIGSKAPTINDRK